MRNISKVNLINKIPNQTLRAKYYAPKTRRDIEELYPDFKTMSPLQIKQLYSNNFLNEHKGDFVSEDGTSFKYKDGTEDVYVKSGYESDVFEYLERNMMDKKKYRIVTDNTVVEFVAGGRVEIDGVLFEIIKVIALTSDISTQNKFRAMRGAKNPQSYAPKLLALI
jgi:hypothetical protein